MVLDMESNQWPYRCKKQPITPELELESADQSFMSGEDK